MEGLKVVADTVLDASLLGVNKSRNMGDVICECNFNFIFSFASLAVSCARAATPGKPCFPSNWTRWFSAENVAHAITRNASRIPVPNASA